jgi:hypothetical protein
MNRRDIVIGVVILIILAGVIYWRQRQTTQEELKVPQTLSVEDQIEEAFNFEIPEDVDKAELSDVSGGSATAIATRKYEDGKFTHAVLADLPDPEVGHYEGWLVKEDELVSTGEFRVAKGGFLLEFESGTDYTDHKDVIVSLEETRDATPEKHILEGSF